MNHFTGFNMAIPAAIALGLLIVLSAGPPPTSGLPTIEELRLAFARRQRVAAELWNETERATEWVQSLGPDGSWPDVDYTTGCGASEAEWNCRDHFYRMQYLGSLFYQNPTDTFVLSRLQLALDFWFSNDMPHEDCINAGGRPDLQCPCGTPGFWNPNWWWAMIGQPKAIAETCFLLDAHLTPSQRANCTNQNLRSYVRIDGDPNGSRDPLTGANRLDIASCGAAYAFMTEDAQVLEDSYAEFYDTCKFSELYEDGVQVDGSFMQHEGLLYTGNYGRQFIDQMLRIMMTAAGTSLAAPVLSQEVMLTLLEATEWMICFKGDDDVDDDLGLFYQPAVSGRMITYKHGTHHGVNFTLAYIIDGTEGWADAPRFQVVSERLSRRTAGSANPGPLVGTRYFHVSDYLVHRGPSYVVSLKMFSPRIGNTECVNDQNPFGFHLSDGSIWTQLSGTEYIDVFGAWDWWMIPGTTVDYGATPLECDEARFFGMEDFVGGVALGNAGLAVMNYTNPATGSLHWAKTFFFFPGAYVVQYVGPFTSSTSNQVVTTLDQRQLAGPARVDDLILVSPQKVRVTAQSLWHDRVGYFFPNGPVTLDIDTTPRPSNWSAIGVSHGYDPEELFSAAVVHDVVAAEAAPYIVSLDIDQPAFHAQILAESETNEHGKIQLLKPADKVTRANAEVRGATYGSSTGTGERIIALAFWTAGDYATEQDDITAVSVDIPVAVLLSRKSGGPSAGWTLSVADPSKQATNVRVEVSRGALRVNFDIELPQGAWAGAAEHREF